jgi:hypothetical protein
MHRNLRDVDALMTTVVRLHALIHGRLIVNELIALFCVSQHFKL